MTNIHIISMARDKIETRERRKNPNGPYSIPFKSGKRTDLKTCENTPRGIKKLGNIRPMNKSIKAANSISPIVFVDELAITSLLSPACLQCKARSDLCYQGIAAYFLFLPEFTDDNRSKKEYTCVLGNKYQNACVLQGKRLT
jgi:hypothetical protein